MQTFVGKDVTVSVEETGVRCRTAIGKEIHLSWAGLRGLRKSVFGDQPKIQGREGSISLGSIASEDRAKLVSTFFSQWKARNLESARKNAFDYLDHNKGFAWVMLLSAFFFFFPVAGILLNEAREIRNCTAALQSDGQWVDVPVVREKKQRVGHWSIWIATEFQGTKIEGTDNYFTRTPEQVPPKTIPVLISPSNPACWTITSSQGERVADWPKRRFFLSYIALFGGALLSMGLVGFVWSIGRLRQKTLFRSEVEAVFPQLGNQ